MKEDLKKCIKIKKKLKDNMPYLQYLKYAILALKAGKSNTIVRLHKEDQTAHHRQKLLGIIQVTQRK